MTRRVRQRFDSMAAWRAAAAAIAANRDLLLSLAGVFFMLPWLAFLLLVPDPDFAKGGTTADSAMTEAALAYFQKIMPYLLGLTVIEVTGTMAILQLLADRSRPTVGQAIVRGLRALPIYVGAMLLFGLAFALVAMLLAGLASLLGSVGMAVVRGGMNAVVIYANLRLMLLAPVIVVEDMRRPVAALRRAWALTRGHALGLLVFVAMLFVGSQVVMLTAGLLIGSVAQMAGGDEAAKIAESITYAGLLGLFLLYLTGVLASTHRQLAEGPAPEAIWPRG